MTQMVGDGSKGWPQLAPFDRIIVTAAAKDVPQALLEQMAVGGIMVIRIEERPGKQDLYRITRTAQGYDRQHLLPVRFVPLVEGVAKETDDAWQAKCHRRAYSVIAAVERIFCARCMRGIIGRHET